MDAFGSFDGSYVAASRVLEVREVVQGDVGLLRDLAELVGSVLSNRSLALALPIIDGIDLRR